VASEKDGRRFRLKKPIGVLYYNIIAKDVLCFNISLSPIKNALPDMQIDHHFSPTSLAGCASL